jgi:DNA-binding response OmpR family regulator
MNAKKILIIDDEREAQELLCEILKFEGYQTFTAADGIAGLESVKSVKPDLILLDILMPQMDGLLVQEKIRENPETAGIPIIFITAKSSVDSAHRAVSSGASGYIEKPFEVKRLLAKIRSLLEKHK